MIKELTKDNLLNFYNEERKINALLCERGNKILNVARENFVCIGVVQCTRVCLDFLLGYFYIEDIISGSTYKSIQIPFDVLLSDDALYKFIDDIKK